MVDNFSLFIIACIYLSKTLLATATCLDFLGHSDDFVWLYHYLYVLDFSKALLYREQYTHFLPFSLFPLRLLIFPHIRTFKMPTQNLRQIFQNQRETQYYRLVIGIRCLCTTLASLIWSDLDFNGGRIDVDEFGSLRESVEDFSEMILS